MRYEELLDQVRSQNAQLQEAIERQATISEDTRRQYEQMVHRLQNDNKSLQRSLDISQRDDHTQEITAEIQAMHMKQMNEWHQQTLEYQRRITELEMRLRVCIIVLWSILACLNCVEGNIRAERQI